MNQLKNKNKNNSSQEQKDDLNEVAIKAEQIISNDLNQKEINSNRSSSNKIQAIECDQLQKVKDQEFDYFEEKNVELIDMPDGEIEETILPDNDIGTDTTNKLPMKTENDDNNEVAESVDKNPEIQTIEPVRSVELADTGNILATSARKEQSDPLISSFEATDYKITIPAPIEGRQIVEAVTEQMTIEDDDDDVQIIETCDSPINIDSDTDDEKTEDQDEEAIPITRLYKPVQNFKQTARKSTAACSAIRILSFEARKQMIESITLTTETFSNRKNKLSKSTTTTTTAAKTNIQSNKKNTRNNNETVNKENSTKVNTKLSINAKSTSNNSADVHDVNVSNSNEKKTNANMNENTSKKNYSNNAKRNVNDISENLSNKKTKSNINITSISIIKAGASNINSENKTNVNKINENSNHNSSAPASTSNVNNNSNGNGKPPLTFVAQLDNDHTVIIPNAFYASQQYGSKAAFNGPKKITTNLGQLVEQQVEWHMKRWLKNFYINFISKQNTATAFSFMLLQQVLSFETYNAIRNRRFLLNALRLNSDTDFDENLKKQMHNIFYLDKDEERLTLIARRFCVLGCTFSGGQTMPLTVDINDGHTTSSTYQAQSDILQAMRPAIEAIEKEQQKRYVATTTATKTKTTANTNKNLIPMTIIPISHDQLIRQQEEQKENPVTCGMQKERTASFDLNNEICNPSDNMSFVEQFALQVQRQDEFGVLTKMATTSDKSFESVFIKTFFRNTHASKKNAKHNGKYIQKLKNFAQINKTTTTRTTTLTETTTANSNIGDFEEMLVPNFLTASTVRKVPPRRPKQKKKQKESINNNNNNHDNKSTKSIPVDSLAKDLCRATKSTETIEPHAEEEKQLEEEGNKAEGKESEVIICDSNDSDDVQVVEQVNEGTELTTDVENTNSQLQQQQSQLSFTVPLNIDPSLCVDSVAAQTCVLCQDPAPDMVNHYVNKHANTEVYISRLSLRQLALLLTSEYSTIAQLHNYLNGQSQYEASCIFCEKRACLTIAHWYQHFTKHTGEYAYRCSGCQLRTTTRGEMTLHIALPCPQYGRLVPEFTHDGDLSRIEAYLCTLCHFVQLKSSLVLEHLLMQHNIQISLPEYVKTVTLMQFSQAVINAESTSASKPVTVTYNDNVNEAEKKEEEAANNAANVMEVEDDNDDVVEVKENVPLKQERNDEPQAIEELIDGEMDVEEFQWINK